MQTSEKGERAVEKQKKKIKKGEGVGERGEFGRACKHLFKYFNPPTAPPTSRKKTVYCVKMRYKMLKCAV